MLLQVALFKNRKAVHMKRNEIFKTLKINNFCLMPGISFELITQLGVSREELMLLFYLYSRCYDDRTTCYPSVGTIAKTLGYKLDKDGKCAAVKRHIRSLKKKGLLLTKNHPEYRSSIYDLGLFLKKCGDLSVVNGPADKKTYEQRGILDEEFRAQYEGSCKNT
jgi:DNA-binding MarR family transcriptional regulator